MRTLIITIILLALAFAAHAASVSLQWDANAPAEQVTGYNVYVDGVKNQTVATNQATATVTPGVHSFYVTAVNAWNESGPSNSVTTPAVTTIPKNVKITITVNVE